MARLHEYQGKALLREYKIAIPEGELARSPKEAAQIAERLGRPVVVKAQVWTTGRADLGLIRFADSPQEAQASTAAILGRVVKGLEVEAVLVIIAREHPEAVARSPIDILTGLPDYRARDLVRRVGIHGKLQLQLGTLLARLYQVARRCEARAAEINPIAFTSEGRLIAADCRITVDDYAVYRHPELRYFIQMDQGFERGQGYVGFHGAGGGGSMMSMDAVLHRGFKLANFVDTSGNPPASKVYRAARIILAQGPIDGYFASGSGVASQEQFHSARGLAKAFIEAPLTVPAVIRLGGNAEEQAIDILRRAQPYIPAPVEAYGKDDTPEFCAERLETLVRSHKPPAAAPPGYRPPPPEKPYSFQTLTGGTVTFDHAACLACENQVCIQTCAAGILQLQDEVPVLNITTEEARKSQGSTIPAESRSSHGYPD